MAKSFVYQAPPASVLAYWARADFHPDDAVCPHCKAVIKYGDIVHEWDGTLWHTKPCPQEA